MDGTIVGRVLFDAVVIYSISYFGVYMDKHWEPKKQGIMCDDLKKISFPYKQNTITPREVVMFSVLAPMIIIFCIDVFVHKRGIQDIYTLITSYMLGSALVFVSCNITKYQLGVLRPYFLTVCDSHNLIDICTQSRSSHAITEDKLICTGDPKEVRQARLSFPSLHSSMTSFAVVFLLAFLNQNIQRTNGNIYKTLKMILQVVALTWLVMVMTSRLTDYRHHLTDVVVGTIWGAVFAFLSILQTSGMVFGIEQSRRAPDMRKLD